MTNVIHASRVGLFIIETGFLLLTGLSILNHSKYNENYNGKNIVLILDVGIVNLLLIEGLRRSIEVVSIVGLNSIMMSFYTCYIASMYIAYTSFFDRKRLCWYPKKRDWRVWHSLLHLFGCFSGHLLIHEYSKTKHLRNN